MARKDRARLRKLRIELMQAYPDLSDAERLIARGLVIVQGRVITNPDSLVPAGAAITLRNEAPLRGEVKLRAALAAFEVEVRDRIALDVGAAAGGFTKVLLEAGAHRVYAVDAGHGQLRGFLRQDARVVNLEKTNLGDLTTDLVPDQVEVVTLDISYLALSDGVPQLERIRIAPGSDAIALVKPQFELGLAQPPSREDLLIAAVERAREAFAAHGWVVQGSMPSPVQGRRGSTEYLVHALRGGKVLPCRR